jgi:hypothetical protein
VSLSLLRRPPSPLLPLGQGGRVHANFPGHFFLRDPEPFSAAGDLFAQVSRRSFPGDIAQEGRELGQKRQGRAVSPFFPATNRVCTFPENLWCCGLQKKTSFRVEYPTLELGKPSRGLVAQGEEGGLNSLWPVSWASFLALAPYRASGLILIEAVKNWQVPCDFSYPVDFRV